MSELWGWASGQQQAQQQQNQNQLTQLQLAEGRQSLEEGEVKIQQEGVALQSAKILLSNQQKMQSLLQQAEKGGPPVAGMTSSVVDQATGMSNHLASQLEQMSQFAVSSGMVKEGSEYAEKASTIRKNAAEIAERAYKRDIKDLTLVASLMDGVHDQQSWNAANMMFMAETGRESKVAHMPYSPELVQRIRAGALTMKDKAQIEMNKARAVNELAAAKEHEARRPLIEAQRQLDIDRDIALRKSGAGGKIPKAENLKALTDLITKDFGGAGDPQSLADARVMARPYAERMEVYMITDGLSQSQAAAKAYREGKDAGAFAGLKPLPADDKGSSPTKPLDVPMKGKALDKEKLVQNQWYKVPGHDKPMLLLGNQFYSEEDLGHSASEEDDENEKKED